MRMDVFLYTHLHVTYNTSPQSSPQKILDVTFEVTLNYLWVMILPCFWQLANVHDGRSDIGLSSKT